MSQQTDSDARVHVDEEDTHHKQAGEYAVLSTSQTLFRPSQWCVAVVFCKRRCTLRYSSATDHVTLTRATERGREQAVLHLATADVVNVESEDECVARQCARGVSDAVVREGYHRRGGVVASSATALQCLCPAVLSSSSVEAVYARSTSHAQLHAADGTGSEMPQLPHDEADDGNEHATTTTTSPSSHAAAAAAVPAQMRYCMHYVCTRNAAAPTLHTIEYVAASWPDGVAQLRTLHAALLRRVYARGVAHLHVFVSPKSGRGDGVHVYASGVYPILHFSRHTVTTCVTTRAHECEDYVANAHHRLGARDVVVAVGGDGMVHEAVNGLHRRKLALLQRWRIVQRQQQQQQQRTQPSQQQQPPLGDVAQHHKALPSMSTASPASTSSLVSPTSSGMMLLSSSSSLLHGATHARDSTASPPSPSRSQTQQPLPSASAPHTTDATWMTQLPRRWDALMPLVATVPAGSACGLAKSMDVLSRTSAALALVHLHTCHMDLLRLRFRDNAELRAHHRQRMSATTLHRAHKAYTAYRTRYAAELHARRVVEQEHAARVATTTTTTATTATTMTTLSMPPYLGDGTPVFADAVAHSVGAPSLRERVAFMSLSFGVANDIDHGSEGLRWMGNARFALYGGYLLLRGIRSYTAVLRYLPWTDQATGLRVEKLARGDKMPQTSQLPQCTMREHCPHCEQHAQSVTCLATMTTASSSSLSLSSCVPPPPPPQDGDVATRHAQTTRSSRSSSSSTDDHSDTSDKSRADKDTAPLVELTPPTAAATTATAAAGTCVCSDEQLLGEDDVDFDDDTLPWVTVRGAFYSLLFCNIRDVAQDMIMAPMSHLSDGSIDIVFARQDDEQADGARGGNGSGSSSSGGGRREFVQFFTSLKTGAHVHYDFTNYVKARAAEVKMDCGIAMADGEMMPLAAVRVSKLRDGVQLVRAE